MLVVVNSKSIHVADSSRLANELNYDGTTYVFDSLKDALIFAIGKAENVESIKRMVESIPKQVNGARYQIANVLEDWFWYIDTVLVDLSACKDWMIKRVVAYA